jgi:hypothetical protein
LALGLGALVVFILGKVVPGPVVGLELLGLDEDECNLGVIRPCREEDIDPGRPLSQQKVCLYDSKGKKLLGRHPNRASALKQERLIQWKKHR